MSEPIAQQSPDSPQHAGHEMTDASAFHVGLFALALAIAIVLSMLLMDRMFWWFEAAAQRADPVMSPVADNQTTPEPRLQVEPRADLAQFRENEDHALHSYKWIDQQQGIVQIPIERAIDLLCERGLPEPSAAEPPTATPEAAP